MNFRHIDRRMVGVKDSVPGIANTKAGTVKTGYDDILLARRTLEGSVDTRHRGKRGRDAGCSETLEPYLKKEVQQ
jgi:hypothetical protein